MKTSIKAFMASLMLGAVAFAAEPAVNVSWSAKDASGAEVKVPVADRPSVVAFVRSDQEQSKATLNQIEASVSDAKTAQVIIIVSGPMANEQAKAMGAELPKVWPVIADPDFTTSGKMNIHVWPTTVIVKPDGTQAAHLAGLPQTFATDLAAYLDFAAGKLDEAKLKEKLATHDIVTDTPTQAAARHLQVAQRLLERGHTDEAKAELAEGLNRSPEDAQIRLTLARVYILLNQPKDALETIEQIAAGSAPDWQIKLMRGRALVAMENWSAAQGVLPEALKLNPEPSEAHYLLALCYQHEKDWAHATEEFRLAFETCPVGHKLAMEHLAK